MLDINRKRNPQLLFVTINKKRSICVDWPGYNLQMWTLSSTILLSIRNLVLLLLARRYFCSSPFRSVETRDPDFGHLIHVSNKHWKNSLRLIVFLLENHFLRMETPFSCQIQIRQILMNKKGNDKKLSEIIFKHREIFSSAFYNLS